ASISLLSLELSSVHLMQAPLNADKISSSLGFLKNEVMLMQLHKEQSYVPAIGRNRVMDFEIPTECDLVWRADFCSLCRAYYVPFIKMV
ncbi:hypothetical protein L9F63_025452, partial [Diploptera punctata]